MSIPVGIPPAQVRVSAFSQLGFRPEQEQASVPKLVVAHLYKYYYNYLHPKPEIAHLPAQVSASASALTQLGLRSVQEEASIPKLIIAHLYKY